MDELIDYMPVLGNIFNLEYSETLWTSIGDELQEMGATATTENCSHCGGVLFDYNNELICGNCSMVVGPASTTGSKTKSLWVMFDENRPRYYNSNKRLCVGGFASTYDWVEREDVDRPIKKLDAESFYE